MIQSPASLLRQHLAFGTLARDTASCGGFWLAVWNRDGHQEKSCSIWWTTSASAILSAREISLARSSMAVSSILRSP